MSKKQKFRRKVTLRELTEEQDDVRSEEYNEPRGEALRFTIKNPYKLNAKQQEILKTGLDDKTQAIFIDGFYGTSKSFLSVLIGLNLLKSNKVKKLIYVRNPVESSTTGKIGFLKGELDAKMAPYKEIFTEKIKELVPTTPIPVFEKDNTIACQPLGFVRGHSWDDTFVIVDEASSFTQEDIVLILTRIGKNSKVMFVGDAAHQSDIGTKSGFRHMFNMFNDKNSLENGIHCFELKEESDIVRSDFVKFIMKKTGMIKSDLPKSRMFPEEV